MTDYLEHHTHVFEPSRKKAMKVVLKNALLILVILAIVLVTFFFGTGLGIISTIAAIVAIVKVKQGDDKDEGIRRFGEKKAKMRLTLEHLYIKQAVIPFSEVQDLLIYADEFTGMRKDEFTNYHGGGSQISFSHKGKRYKFKSGSAMLPSSSMSKTWLPASSSNTPQQFKVPPRHRDALNCLAKVRRAHQSLSEGRTSPPKP